MSKTPVSILQEMMVKNLSIPAYELIHDGGGSHANTFTYRVTCNGLTAVGMGRSKKDAKHEAAKAMLKTIAKHRGHLQLPASPAQSPVRTPLPPVVPEVRRIPPNVPFVNAVGVLQDLCVANNLTQPKYELISEVGPPHAKVFTIQCEVSTFKEIGVARTKKQAKQDAAKQMLDKLTNLVPQLKISCDSDTIQQENISGEIAKTRYPTLSKLPISKKINVGVKIAEYHIQLKNQFDNEQRQDLIEKLSTITSSSENSVDETYVATSVEKIQELLKSIDLDMIVTTVPSMKDKTLVGMQINTSPNIVEIGLGNTRTEANLDAISKSVNTLIDRLK